MKEQIYTIPVNEAFNTDCECPMCFLEKNIENQGIEYVLGPSLMEPDQRIESNEKGFCRRHFEMLYNRQENRLGLGLILDTHLVQQISEMKQKYSNNAETLKKEAQADFVRSFAGRFSSKQSASRNFAAEMISFLADLEAKCIICSRLEYTMDRYVDVILYLWFKEKEFRARFNSRKGFCLMHLKQLLQGTVKYLSQKDAALFIDNLMELQLKNMERIQEEVHWFTEKFDYRNADAPWGNSKDALPRGIQKISGYMDLK